MLVLARKEGESLVISGNIHVTVLEIQGNRVRLGVSAPRSVPVHREEIQKQLDDERRTDVLPLVARRDLAHDAA